MEVNEIVLNAKFCSGRGVRFKVLDPYEHDAITLDAAKVVGMEGTMIELRKLEWKMGVKRMIVAVTKDGGYKDTDDLISKEAAWRKMTVKDLDEEYNKLFTAKDDQFLCAMFRQYHEVSEDELQAISGKARTVSVD